MDFIANSPTTRTMRLARRKSQTPAWPHGALWRCAGSLAAGALLGVTWLEPRLFPGAWVGTLLFILILLGQRPKYAFRYGLLAGEACMWTGFYWLPSTAAENLHVSLVTGGLVALLAITWDAFRFGIFAYLAAVIRPGAAAIVWPCVWVALEWLWPHIFPWRLGHSQSAWLEVIQIAEFAGVYAVSFLMVLAAASAATLIRAWLARREEGANAMRYALFQAGACALLISSISIWGHWRVAQLESGLTACCSPRLRVALIQPGTTGEPMLETCRAKSREVMQQADLICWPESSIGDYPLLQTNFRLSADEPRDVPPGASQWPTIARPLLCGGGSYASAAGSDGPLLNTAFLIDAQQNILGRYHKRALAPWGEYVVGQQWIPGLRELFGIHAEFRPGDSAAPLQLPVPDSRHHAPRDAARHAERDGYYASLGVLICYEDLLEDHARETVLAGANVLVNLNNLSAFGRSPAIRQHQQLAQFRAVENRRYLLRCGTVGSTAIISATGRVVAQAPPHAAAAIVQAVPLAEGQTFYTQWGNVFAVACLLVTAILVVRRAVCACRIP